MKKQIIFYTLIIIIIISLLGIFTSGTLSVASGITGGTANWDCGYYQQSYIKDYIDTFAKDCHDEGFDCYKSEREGSQGTIYSATCQQTCYECNNGETKIYSFTEGCKKASEISGNKYEEIPNKYLTNNENNEDLYYDYDQNEVEKICVPTINCYQCDNNNELIQWKFKGECGDGWSENKPSCEPQKTCYQCDGSRIVTKKFDNVCPSNWVSYKPTCENNEKTTCYRCENGILKTSEEYNTCPTGSTPYEQNCKDEITCYACQSNNLKTQNILGNKCPTGWNEEKITCSENNNVCYTCINGVKTAMDFPQECDAVPGNWKSEPINNCETTIQNIDLKKYGPYIIIGVISIIGLLIILRGRKNNEF